MTHRASKSEPVTLKSLTCCPAPAESEPPRRPHKVGSIWPLVRYIDKLGRLYLREACCVSVRDSPVAGLDWMHARN